MTPVSSNTLYPIFLKPQELNILIVGGGNVGYEKLSFLLKSSPDANVTLVATNISKKIFELLQHHPQVDIYQRRFRINDLKDKRIAILATNNRVLNKTIRRIAKRQNILVNVADTPDLCDFYLGSIVTKGDLKIAFSTNGKSPTVSKRLRQLFESVLPDELGSVISNLRNIRDQLQGDFAHKVKSLNELTSGLISGNINTPVDDKPKTV